LYELTVESRFDSAHNLRGYEGACESLHGHTYRVQVVYSGQELNELGMLIDFKNLKEELGRIVGHLDHRYLNELEEFSVKNPTAEHLAQYIFKRMRKALGVGITSATVWETPTSAATYRE
jgi:6-pyruvoyltetrahydropterin/6-carboxytetrahydropterin synthase